MDFLKSAVKIQLLQKEAKLFFATLFFILVAQINNYAFICLIFV
jgi:hypothetical protein